MLILFQLLLILLVLQFSQTLPLFKPQIALLLLILLLLIFPAFLLSSNEVADLLAHFYQNILLIFYILLRQFLQKLGQRNLYLLQNFLQFLLVRKLTLLLLETSLPLLFLCLFALAFFPLLLLFFIIFTIIFIFFTIIFIIFTVFTVFILIILQIFLFLLLLLLLFLLFQLLLLILQSLLIEHMFDIAFNLTPYYNLVIKYALFYQLIEKIQNPIDLINRLQIY